jgi:hypothetical protein
MTLKRPRFFGTSHLCFEKRWRFFSIKTPAFYEWKRGRFTEIYFRTLNCRKEQYNMNVNKRVTVPLTMKLYTKLTTEPLSEESSRTATAILSHWRLLCTWVDIFLWTVIVNHTITAMPDAPVSMPTALSLMSDTTRCNWGAWIWQVSVSLIVNLNGLIHKHWWSRGATNVIRIVTPKLLNSIVQFRRPRSSWAKINTFNLEEDLDGASQYTFGNILHD